MALPPQVFVPPPFDLYEFDNDQPALAKVPTRRWFSGWNGQIGQSPQNVTLGWSAGDAAALVCTESGDFYDDAFGRVIAAHLALGGTELPLSTRPGSATAIKAEIDRITAADSLWSAAPPMVPGGPPAQVAVLTGFVIAYCRVVDDPVFVAAVGVAPDRFRIRKVQDWTAYDHDATKAFPLSALKS